MRAYNLEKMDADFKRTLNAAGRKFSAKPGQFQGVVELTSKDKSTFFYKETTKKQKIVVHMTHGVITGDLFTLTQPDNHVSVSFVIARDGTIYQLFSDQYWAYHIGKSTSAPNSVWSPKTIGIEISNIGPLTEDATDSNILVDAYGKPYCLKSDTQYYQDCNYRGYKYYATMTDAQYRALDGLVLNLCRKHNIPFTKLPKDKAYNFYPQIPETGIIFHSNVRKDKVDLSPVFDFDRLHGR